MPIQPIAHSSLWSRIGSTSSWCILRRLRWQSGLFNTSSIIKIIKTYLGNKGSLGIVRSSKSSAILVPAWNPFHTISTVTRKNEQQLTSIQSTTCYDFTSMLTIFGHTLLFLTWTLDVIMTSSWHHPLPMTSLWPHSTPLRRHHQNTINMTRYRSSNLTCSYLVTW